MATKSPLDTSQAKSNRLFGRRATTWVIDRIEAKLMKTIAKIVCLSTIFLAPVARIGAGEPRDSGDIQVPKICDFAKMTETEAKQLDGKSIKARVSVIDATYNQETNAIAWFLCENKATGYRYLAF